MESRVQLIAVVVVSLLAGSFVNELLSRDAEDAASVPYAELVSDHKIAAADLARLPPVVAPAPIPEPVAVPAIHPIVSFALIPIALPEPVVEPVEPERVVVAEIDGFESDSLGDDVEPEVMELDYVGTLRHDGADVEDGFSGLDPGTLTRMTWRAGESLYGSAIPTPILVAEGTSPGSTLCLTGAVHGDELNGIETVRRVMYSLNPEKLSGRVVGVPIVNLQGFERHSRYLPDRRDLNRFFPGNPRGSSASRIAFSFFEKVVRHCDALVDLHTGSFHRTNLPQLRANLLNESVLDLTQGFGGLVILHSAGGTGTLRAAALRAGIPSVTLEAGEPLRVDDDAVALSVRALFTLLDNLKMYERRSLWGNPEPTYYGSMWVRADKGGMLLGEVKLGRKVKEGDVLGTVTDPITNVKQEILAPRAGRVIGMALNQFVMPGYAAFHLGVEAPSVDELHQTPGDDGDHSSVARADGMVDERDDSDE